MLDNIEHLLPAASEVGALLSACPVLKVLTTSREPLGLRRAHAAHVLGFVEQAKPRVWGADQAEWTPRLVVEQDDVRPALRWLLCTKAAVQSTRHGLRRCPVGC